MNTPDRVPQHSDNLSDSGSGGSNLSRVRAHNERLVLSVIRKQALSRADIARATGLAPQTITLITRSLSDEGLLTSGQPVRGKVGQPSVPLSLNPEGAYFLGLKIGRRSVEMILMNFTGDIIEQRTQRHAYPAPQPILHFLRREIPALSQSLGEACVHKLHGVGVAMPFELWNWVDKMGAPAAVIEQWRDIDLVAQIEAITELPVFLENDVTSACGAELTFGKGQQYQSFGYFFIGYFIGGALVLNGSVYTGQTGNAGAFGSLPVTDPDSPGGVVQLIDTASLQLLENTDACQAALKGAHLEHDSAFWATSIPITDQWVDRTSRSLAMAIVSINSIVDVQAILIDGGFPGEIRDRIVEAVQQALQELNTRGIRIPTVEAGQIGPGARALGAARLPLYSRFLLDESVLTAGTR